MTLDKFWPGYYLKTNPDVAKSGYGTLEKAEEHYKRHGIKEGRSPSLFFDPVFYLEHHSDLSKAFGKDFAAAKKHWQEYGAKEGRRGSFFFHPRFYLEHHSDLVKAYGKSNYDRAAHHWLSFGIEEGRKTTSDPFDKTIWVDGDGLVHYVTFPQEGLAGDVDPLIHAVANTMRGKGNDVLDPKGGIGGGGGGAASVVSIITLTGRLHLVKELYAFAKEVIKDGVAVHEYFGNEDVNIGGDDGGDDGGGWGGGEGDINDGHFVKTPG